MCIVAHSRFWVPSSEGVIKERRSQIESNTDIPMKIASEEPHCFKVIYIFVCLNLPTFYTAYLKNGVLHMMINVPRAATHPHYWNIQPVSGTTQFLGIWCCLVSIWGMFNSRQSGTAITPLSSICTDYPGRAPLSESSVHRKSEIAVLCINSNDESLVL